MGDGGRFLRQAVIFFLFGHPGRLP